MVPTPEEVKVQEAVAAALEIKKAEDAKKTLEERLAEASKKEIEKIKKAEYDPAEIAALKSLAIKGMLADVKDDVQRGLLSKLVDGKSIAEAESILETFKSLIPKPGPVGGVPVATTGQKPIGFFERKSPYEVAQQKSEHRW